MAAIHSHCNGWVLKNMAFVLGSEKVQLNTHTTNYFDLEWPVTRKSLCCTNLYFSIAPLRASLRAYAHAGTRVSRNTVIDREWKTRFHFGRVHDILVLFTQKSRQRWLLPHYRRSVVYRIYKKPEAYQNPTERREPAKRRPSIDISIYALMAVFSLIFTPPFLPPFPLLPFN